MAAAVTNEVVVYRATNRVNGKCYIGFTKRGLAKREYHHRRLANSGGGSMLHKAMRKYGHENVVFEQLFDFDGDIDLALMYEAELIAKEKPAYNIQPGGTYVRGPDAGGIRIRRKSTPEERVARKAAFKGRAGSFSGKVHSVESRAKISAKLIGKPGPWAGKPRSDETKAKISAANKGKPSASKGRVVSIEARAHQSAVMRGRPRNMTEKAVAANKLSALRMIEMHKRSVLCVTDGREFGSAADADVFYGMYKGSVTRVLTGKRKSANKLVFIYKKEI